MCIKLKYVEPEGDELLLDVQYIGMILKPNGFLKSFDYFCTI